MRQLHPRRGYAGLAPFHRVGGHPGTGGPGRRAAPEPHHAPGRAHARGRGLLRALPAPDRRHGRGREPVSPGLGRAARRAARGRAGPGGAADRRAGAARVSRRVSADRHHAGRDGPHGEPDRGGRGLRAARGRAAGLGAGGAHDGQAAAHQRRQPGLSGAPRRAAHAGGPGRACLRALCLAVHGPRRAMGMAGRAGRAHTHAARSRHGQQCRSLYRQLPGGPGADPDPGL